jgi:hypothetical protein
MLHLDEQQNTQNVIMQALRALADYYVAHINQFAGDGRYSPERRVNLLGTSQRHEYVGFLRSTVDAAFKAHRWNQTAMLNKLSEAGTLHGAEKDRHTKKVSIEGVKHRMVCIKWSTLFPDDSRAP